MSKVVQIVNDRIMKELESGTIPWQKPWTGVRNGAYSRSTGKPYSLINQMLLNKPGEYLTINQIMESGGRLKADEKSQIVVFWKQVGQKDDETTSEDTRSYPVLRFYKVYHIDQCENIEPAFKPEELPDIEPDAMAEKMRDSYIERSGCTLQHIKQNRAFYAPANDSITLPLREQFPTVAGYYSTMFHEIAHSSGHPNRLNRFEVGEYSHVSYSREELVAELTAASVLNRLGLETDANIRNTAAYIQSWLSALKNDKRMLLWAAARAEKALGIITEDVEIVPQARMREEIKAEETVADKPMTATKAAAKKKPTGRAAKKPVKKPAVKPVATTPASTSAAVLAFAKASAKAMQKERPHFAGAFTYGERQYITNGYIVASYETPFDGLPEADVSTANNGATLESFINAARIGVAETLPPLSEMRTQFQEAKKKAGVKGYVQYTRLKTGYFNTEYLITAMELAGVEGGQVARAQNAVKPMYILGEGCEVVVSPVRVSGMPGEDVWRPKLTA